MSNNAVRERIDLRVNSDTKQLAERASAVLGCSSLTEYIVRLIHENAPKTLNNQTTIELTNEKFDQFLKACEGEHIVPNRLIEASKLLDKEGF
jgi:uncharacterized protein (DUF1778 family)